MSKHPRRRSEPQLNDMLKAEQEQVINSWLSKINTCRDFATRRSTIARMIQWAKLNNEVDVVREVIRRGNLSYEVETMRLRKMVNPNREKLLDRYIYLERKLEITKSQKTVNKIVYELGQLEILHGITTDEVMARRKELREKRNPVNSDLYESFHGNPPKGTTKVYYEPPKGTLIKIGELSEIRYKPTAPSKHSGVEFFHKSGDTGNEVLATNLILCTDSSGKNLYLVKKNKNVNRPYFSDRGIIG